MRMMGGIEGVGVGQGAVDVNEDDGGIEGVGDVGVGQGAVDVINQKLSDALTYQHETILTISHILYLLVYFIDYLLVYFIDYLLVYFRCTKGSSAVARDSGTTHTCVLHV